MRSVYAHTKGFETQFNLEAEIQRPVYPQTDCYRLLLTFIDARVNTVSKIGVGLSKIAGLIPEYRPPGVNA